MHSKPFKLDPINSSQAVDLERQKTARQEQSRAAVVSGLRSSLQNHFLSKEALLTTSYSFKG